MFQHSKDRDSIDEKGLNFRDKIKNRDEKTLRGLLVAILTSN